jgi:GNAT superfamily N-acetyltransferase
MSLIQLILALPEHLPKMQRIRELAFEPVFASFRKVLGDEIYELAQQPEDDAQANLLVSYLRADSEWKVYVAVFEYEVVGFITLKIQPLTMVGEIGLNAIDPQVLNRGFGTAMYEFALDRLREAGMKVAVVATGADASHHPARHAYRKAGFDVEIPSTWMCRKL